MRTGVPVRSGSGAEGQKRGLRGGVAALGPLGGAGESLGAPGRSDQPAQFGLVDSVETDENRGIAAVMQVGGELLGLGGDEAVPLGRRAGSDHEHTGLGHAGPTSPARGEPLPRDWAPAAVALHVEGEPPLLPEHSGKSKSEPGYGLLIRRGGRRRRRRGRFEGPAVDDQGHGGIVPVSAGSLTGDVTDHTFDSTGTR